MKILNKIDCLEESICIESEINNIERLVYLLILMSVDFSQMPSNVWPKSLERRTKIQKNINPRLCGINLCNSSKYLKK